MATSIALKVDHVTIAGSRLARVEEAFAQLGLATDYGGPHSNGITHMALLGFDDGSYIELISSLEPGQKDGAFWGEFIAGDGGPCAWAVYVDDVEAEAQRMRSLGVTVDGPHYYNRRRPDGALVEWNLAFLGDEGAGAVIPFIIKDITPRELRVQPSASVTGRNNQPALLTGISKVVLSVNDLAEAAALFQRLYSWPEPQVKDVPHIEAALANFEHTPVILAAPLTDSSTLAQRLARFGESPWAYLIGTSNFQAACAQYALTLSDGWFEDSLGWFDAETLNGTKLGVIS